MKFLSQAMLSLVVLLGMFACKNSEKSSSSNPKNPSSETNSSASLRPSSSPSIVEGKERFPSEISLDFEVVADQVRDLVFAHPNEVAEILEHFALKLYEDDPAKAIDIIFQYSHLTPNGRGDQLAAKLLKSWNDTDPAALESRLHTLAKHRGGTEVECHRALCLLMDDESFSSATWVEWVNELSKGSENKGELQGEALNAILSLVDASDSSQFELVANAYRERLQDPGLQKHIPEFGDLLAKHYPEDVEALLADIPGGVYREATLERVIAELARSHPEVATEWLSSQDVLTKIFRPEFEEVVEKAVEYGVSDNEISEAEQAFKSYLNDVFDKTLETYIYGLVHQYPEDALESVNSVIDPERREELRVKVQAIVDTYLNEEEESP